MTYKLAYKEACEEFNVDSHKILPKDKRFKFFLAIEDKILGTTSCEK